MTGDNAAFRVELHGLVTGVGFRYAAMDEARQYDGIVGYVRNVDAHTVECVIQGPRKAVHAMIDWLRQGPPSAQVQNCIVEEIPVNSERTSFRLEL